MTSYTGLWYTGATRVPAAPVSRIMDQRKPMKMFNSSPKTLVKVLIRQPLPLLFRLRAHKPQFLVLPSHRNSVSFTSCCGCYQVGCLFQMEH